jgi:hypothetical protein
VTRERDVSRGATSEHDIRSPPPGPPRWPTRQVFPFQTRSENWDESQPLFERFEEGFRVPATNSRQEPGFTVMSNTMKRSTTSSMRLTRKILLIRASTSGS